MKLEIFAIVVENELLLAVWVNFCIDHHVPFPEPCTKHGFQVACESLQPVLSCSCLNKPSTAPTMIACHVVAILFTNFKLFVIVINLQTDVMMICKVKGEKNPSPRLQELVLHNMQMRINRIGWGQILFKRPIQMIFFYYVLFYKRYYIGVTADVVFVSKRHE